MIFRSKELVVWGFILTASSWRIGQDEKSGLFLIDVKKNATVFKKISSND
jgi:hypothetical protein